ncbi:hypothetical protein Nmel_005030 [Mimus melanotis]
MVKKRENRKIVI